MGQSEEKHSAHGLLSLLRTMNFTATQKPSEIISSIQASGLQPATGMAALGTPNDHSARGGLTIRWLRCHTAPTRGWDEGHECR